MARETNVQEAEEVKTPAAESTEENDFEDTDGSDLFDDSEEEDDEEPEEDTDSEEEDEADEDEGEGDAEEPEEEDEPAKPEKGKTSKKPETTVKNLLEVTYNGKKEEIDPFGERAKELIQKGMDHPHKTAKLAEYEKVLTEYAKANGGLTVDDALKTLTTSTNAAMEAKELEDLKKQYPNSDEELLTALAKANASAKAITLKKSAEETESTKRMQELQKEYPKYAKLEDLPKEVQAAIEGGKTPLQAVKDAEIATLTKQVADLQKDIEAAKQNKQNQDRAMKPAKGTAGDKKTDSFLRGLNA